MTQLSCLKECGPVHQSASADDGSGTGDLSQNSSVTLKVVFSVDKLLSPSNPPNQGVESQLESQVDLALVLNRRSQPNVDLESSQPDAQHILDFRFHSQPHTPTNRSTKRRPVVGLADNIDSSPIPFNKYSSDRNVPIMIADNV